MDGINETYKLCLRRIILNPHSKSHISPPVIFRNSSLKEYRKCVINNFDTVTHFIFVIKKLDICVFWQLKVAFYKNCTTATKKCKYNNIIIT